MLNSKLKLLKNNIMNHIDLEEAVAIIVLIIVPLVFRIIFDFVV